MKPKKQLNMLGRKIYVYYQGERYHSPAFVLGSFRQYWIVYFFYDDKSVMAVTKKEITEVTPDKITEKTRLKYRKQTMAKAREVIEMIKKNEP